MLEEMRQARTCRAGCRRCRPCTRPSAPRTGARWFATTTTSMPLSSVKVSGWKTPDARGCPGTRFRPASGSRPAWPSCSSDPVSVYCGQRLAAGPLGDHAAGRPRPPAAAAASATGSITWAARPHGAALEVQDEQESAVVEADQLGILLHQDLRGCRARPATLVCATAAPARPGSASSRLAAGAAGRSGSALPGPRCPAPPARARRAAGGRRL